MKIEQTYVFSKEETQKLIGLVAETYCSSSFNTGKVQREFKTMFKTEEEQNTALSLMKRCRTWWLKTGCPENMRLSEDEFVVWQTLEVFCTSLMLR